MTGRQPARHRPGKDATRQARIRLGEIINNAIMTKRNADTRALDEVMARRKGLLR